MSSRIKQTLSAILIQLFATFKSVTAFVFFSAPSHIHLYISSNE